MGYRRDAERPGRPGNLGEFGWFCHRQGQQEPRCGLGVRDLTRIGNGNSTMPTLVFSIYRSGFRFFGMGDAGAQAVVLTAIILLMTLIYFRLPTRGGDQA